MLPGTRHDFKTSHSSSSPPPPVDSPVHLWFGRAVGPEGPGLSLWILRPSVAALHCRRAFNQVEASHMCEITGGGGGGGT